MEKYYKRRLFRGNTMYEAEMFYVPWFTLDKGILKVKAKEDNIPKKFSWLLNLIKHSKVYYGIFEGEKQGVYYTLKDRFNKEQFCLDVSKGVIINEY